MDGTNHPIQIVDLTKLRAYTGTTLQLAADRNFRGSGNTLTKAHTLAIVDATLSDVSKLSERTLYYSSNSPAFVRSHTGLLSILQALAYGVYARDTAQYDDRIRAFRLK